MRGLRILGAGNDQELPVGSYVESDRKISVAVIMTDYMIEVPDRCNRLGLRCYRRN